MIHGWKEDPKMPVLTEPKVAGLMKWHLKIGFIPFSAQIKETRWEKGPHRG